MAGPPIRTDIVDVYVFRRPLSHVRSEGSEGRIRPTTSLQFLQLHRGPHVSLPATWHPVMGHMHDGETAARTALRELREETGYASGAGLLGFWQLEQPNVYFLHSHEALLMSPCFAVEVQSDREPIIDADHDAARWVRRAYVDRCFLWPGQRSAIASLVRDILEPGSPVERALRIDPAAHV